jgi:hypothetical protein
MTVNSLVTEVTAAGNGATTSYTTAGTYDHVIS